MRVVLDTNVLISALMFGGNPREILQRAKFGFSVTAVNQILSELTAIAELVVPANEISLIGSDPTDNRVLVLA